MARNVVTSRRAEITGLKELTAKLEGLSKALQGRDQSALAKDALQAIGETAQEEIADRARSIAQSRGVSDEVRDSIFADYRLTGIKQKLSALAGVNKRASMREWRATANPSSPRAKVSPGGKVAMSRASMYEFGTSKQRPTPYLRPAVEAARVSAPTKLAGKLRGVLGKWASR